MKVKMDFKDMLLSNHCRICLTVHEQMIAILTLKESTELNLLLNYFNIEVVADIRYPNQICIICLNQLNNIVLFKQKCETTCNFLKNFLKNLNENNKKEINGHEIPQVQFLVSVFNEPIKTEDKFNEIETDDKKDEETIINNDIKIEAIENSDVKSESDTYEYTDNEIKLNSTITNNYICQHCEKTFKNKCRLSRHEAIHLKKQFKSNQCSKTFKNNDILFRHVRVACTKTDEPINNNLQIEKSDVKSETNTFEDRDSESQIDSTIINNYTCHHCDKTFKSNFRLSRHEAIHLTKSFKCDQCTKTFKNNDLLLKHVRIHLGQKPFACTECSRTFFYKSGLVTHERNHHSNKPIPKTLCKQCGYAVVNISIHNKYKHTEREFQCKYCNKKFAFKSELKTHVNDFHENCQESFKILCPLCGRVFRRNADLNYHKKIHHSDERNYPCKYCEKRFKTSSVRAKHMKVHSNVRPFKCTYCQRQFKQNRTLLNHIRTHTGERPYKCTLCSKDFAQSGALITHVKLVHGQNFKHK